MKNLLVKLAFITLCNLFCASMFAQSGVTVKVKLEDAKSGDPVGFATVSLTEPNSETAYKYVLSNADGKAEIKNVKSGTFTFKAELMGYKVLEKQITVEKKNVDLGTLEMSEDVKMLDAASVSAAGNPIIVKKDTIEYTASSFKTTDNDMLEDLLKKLPGVEVSSDGTITANGEEITKITIDGKTFFLDDPQLASKNLPAKIIEKVKVVEKKSDQALFTGIDDGEEETVIDLSVYKGMMHGWFGNLMGGGGHDLPESGYYTDDNTWKEDGWRYQMAGMAGHFTEDSQISLIVNGNNTNNRGFNDLAGSMMQNMRGSRGMGRGTGGWGSNNGITKSWMAGANGAFTLLDGDMDLSANYVYNWTDKDVEEDSKKITYLDDGSSLIYDNNGYNSTRSQGHRFGVRLDHKISENTSILFEPQFNFGKGSYTEYTDFTTYTDPGDGTGEALTNKGFTENTGENSSWTTSGFFLFRQRLGKPGRTISMNIRYDISNNELNGFNQSYTHYADSTYTDEYVNQRYEQESDSYSVTARVSYTEPLAEHFYLEANYSYGWNKSTSDKDTYDSGSNNFTSEDENHLTYSSSGATYNDSYSNNITNKYQNHSAGLNLQFQKENIRLQVGASVKPTVTDNETNGETYSSTVVNWAPQMMFSYDFGENSNVRFFYNGRSSQPSTSQLMPVADNSDPLNVSFGNPYLEPYFTHSLRGMFGYTNKQTFTSVHGRLGASFVKNPIVNAAWYDSNGAQYALPVNGPNSGNADIRVMVNSPFKRSKFSIYSMTYFKYSQASSYVGKTDGNKGDELIEYYYDSSNGVMDYETFHTDFFDHSNSERDLNFDDFFNESKTQTLSFTQRLRFTFRSDIVELNLGGRTRMSKSWYTITSTSQNPTWSNQVDASMNWTIPGGIGFMGELDYNWYNGYTTDQDDEFIFNAEISKLLFKDKVTLAVKAYDIFNQAKNLSVTDESNYHQEVRNNTLGRYIMVSLTYRFGSFNGNNTQRRGPGGFGGPPPMR